MSKLESRIDENPGNSSSNQLLCEIEAISRALYLQKSPQKPSSITLPRKNTEDVTNKFRSSSSLWNWKKPLRALSHIRDRKFSSSFFLHVHSIEGLPTSFNDSTLQVQFKRKNEVITTQPSRVSKGTADFDETLIDRCNVYCRRNGPQNSCIYEPKIFVVHASVVGVFGFDIGKHWVDLTRLLPLAVEELVGEKSTGRWATSFKLSGNAKGAILNVSFGYSVTTGSLHEARNRSSTKEYRYYNGSMSRSSDSVPLSRFLNMNKEGEGLASPDLELSKSIRSLYRKLDEGGNVDAVEGIEEYEGDDVEFVVIDRGIELECAEESTGDEQSVPTLENVSISDSKEAKKSIGLDDLSESVASEFLNIVGEESDEEEAESPRERLLREFEAEAVVSGDFIFCLESGDEEEESEDYTTTLSSSSVFESAGEEEDDTDTRIQSIQYRRKKKAEILEELETEALMRQWGFDETSFRDPPRCPSGSGFGSPIEVVTASEDPLAESKEGFGISPSGIEEP